MSPRDPFAAPAPTRQLHCRRCGHTWAPRIKDPVACPACFRNWRTEPAWRPGKGPRNTCRRCGYRWTGRLARAPVSCTRCGSRNWRG